MSTRATSTAKRPASKPKTTKRKATKRKATKRKTPRKPRAPRKHKTKAGTIQWGSVVGRKKLAELVEKHLGNYKVVEKGGHLRVYLETPIKKGEIRAIWPQFFRRTSMKPKHDKQDFLRSVRILASASKMGCWGFNLPAGPPKWGGTCSATQVGFPDQIPADEPSAKFAAQIPKLNRKLRLSVAGQATPIDPDTYICSGCYALKGRYATALIVACLEVKHLVLLGMIKKKLTVEDDDKEKVSQDEKEPKGFADLMERAIRLGQLKSLEAIEHFKATKQYRKIYSVPNPAFFRIHDSGEAYSQRYLAEWFEVARRFSKPVVFRGVECPAVSFWMPTRQWLLAGGKSCPGWENMGCAPPNMTIRPSSLHFGAMAPDLRHEGYAGGSAAATQEVWENVAEWQCPAYLPPKEGGGATKDQFGKWVQGCCARSLGPMAATSKADQRSPVGHGCRVCWLSKATSVTYQEH